MLYTVFVCIRVNNDTSPLWWSRSIELSCSVFSMYSSSSTLIMLNCAPAGHRCLPKADSIVQRLSCLYSLPLDFCISVKSHSRVLYNSQVWYFMQGFINKYRIFSISFAGTINFSACQDTGTIRGRGQYHSAVHAVQSASVRALRCDTRTSLLPAISAAVSAEISAVALAATPPGFVVHQTVLHAAV